MKPRASESVSHTHGRRRPGSRVAHAVRRVGAMVPTIDSKVKEIVDQQGVLSISNETEQMVVRTEVATWPLLDEDKHAAHALERRKESRRGETDQWMKNRRMMRLAERRGSSQYCGCSKCSEVPNRGVLNNGRVVVEKASATWFETTSYGHGATGIANLGYSMVLDNL